MFHMKSRHDVNSHQMLEFEISHVISSTLRWTMVITIATALHFSYVFRFTAAYKPVYNVKPAFTPLSLEELKDAVSDCVENLPKHVDLKQTGPTEPERPFIAFNGKLRYCII